MTRETDCLVIGSGIAGLSAALALAEAGLKTVVITAAPTVWESNTNYAQGGIVFPSEESGAGELLKDIFEAGAQKNYRPAVEQLLTWGPRLVREVLIEQAQVPFDRDDAGGFHFTREGGHSAARILHKGDESGRSLGEALYRSCEKNQNVQFLTKTTAVNLLMTSHHSTDQTVRHGPARCFGAFVFDQETETVYPVFAQHTVLASGGVGQLYLHNTNSRFARGDGIALAHRAGCRLADLEYLQFHPTTFYHPTAKRFLISEAVRGEGGILVNQQGERFLHKYIPNYSEPDLAPRDRVAKAIHQEMLSSGSAHVFLDIHHKPADWIRERFPFVYRKCLENGVDITREPIPVVPGAHFHCGGVWAGLEGETNLPHLWAVGEVACTGVHGANRLASTSLLEGLVWGTRAGRAIADRLEKGQKQTWPDIEPWQSATADVDPSFLRQDWLMLKHTNWNYVGLIKTEARLNRALGILTELHRGIESFYRQARLSDDLIGLRHATLVSMLILQACKANPSSLGCYQFENREI